MVEAEMVIEEEEEEEQNEIQFESVCSASSLSQSRSHSSIYLQLQVLRCERCLLVVFVDFFQATHTNKQASKQEQASKK